MHYVCRRLQRPLEPKQFPITLRSRLDSAYIHILSRCVYAVLAIDKAQIHYNIHSRTASLLLADTQLLPYQYQA